jgi:hypothetical protein
MAISFVHIKLSIQFLFYKLPFDPLGRVQNVVGYVCSIKHRGIKEEEINGYKCLFFFIMDPVNGITFKTLSTYHQC